MYDAAENVEVDRIRLLFVEQRALLTREASVEGMPVDGGGEDDVDDDDDDHRPLLQKV